MPFVIFGTVRGVNPPPETRPGPTLDTAGLVALSLMLALFALVVLRRRA